MKNIFILFLLMNVLSCTEESTRSCSEAKSFFIKKDFEVNQQLEDWYLEVLSTEPNLLYNDIKTLKEMSSSKLSQLTKEKTLRCSISVEKNNIIKTFYVNNISNDINIIFESRVTSSGSTVIMDIPYPYTTHYNSKLVNCKLDGKIYNCVFLVKKEINYDNGVKLTLEYFGQ